MKRKAPRAPNDPGITRLPTRRSYRCDNPEDMAEMLARQEAASPKWNAGKAWTFDGRVSPVRRLATELAPEWYERRRSVPYPTRGTAAWIAEKILDRLNMVRRSRRTTEDAVLIAAFEAGQWYGHLATKLDVEDDALRGERALEHAREVGRLGGRALIVGVPQSLLAVVEARGSARKHQAEALAASKGVRPDSVLRAARRLRKRSR